MILQHSYPVESFIEAIERLYEEVVISNAIVVCLNEYEVEQWTKALIDHQYSVLEWTPKTPPPIRQLKESANRVLVVPYPWMLELNSIAFAHTLVASGWNALISVNVPLYQMDAVFQRVLDANAQGFYGTQEDFHLMWYLD
jgi:hypothetical protein